MHTFIKFLLKKIDFFDKNVLTTGFASTFFVKFYFLLPFIGGRLDEFRIRLVGHSSVLDY